MVDRRKALHRQVVTGAHDLPTSILDTMIPYSSIVENMGARRAPLATYAASSTAARAYDALWSEIRDRSRL
jgi:cellulose biosynthesis protein BcsQ